MSKKNIFRVPFDFYFIEDVEGRQRENGSVETGKVSKTLHFSIIRNHLLTRLCVSSSISKIDKC